MEAETLDTFQPTNQASHLILQYAQSFHNSLKTTVQAAEQLILFIGPGKKLEEYTKDALYHEFMQQLQILYLQDYISERLQFLIQEGQIEHDDALPLETIIDLPGPEFKRIYTDEEFGNKRVVLLTFERALGIRKLYQKMR